MLYAWPGRGLVLLALVFVGGWVGQGVHEYAHIFHPVSVLEERVLGLEKY